jgi:hypothetical protein
VNVTDESFAGDGVMDRILPGERWLLPYSPDEDVQVSSRVSKTQSYRRVRAAQSQITLTGSELSRVSYTIENVSTLSREVLVRHKIDQGWTVDANIKPEEASETHLSLRVHVDAGHTQILSFDQHRPIQATYDLTRLTDEQVNQWGSQKIFKPEVETGLRGLATARSEITQVEQQVNQMREQISRLQLSKLQYFCPYSKCPNNAAVDSLAKSEARLLPDGNKELLPLKQGLSELESKRTLLEEKLRAMANAITFDEAI